MILSSRSNHPLARSYVLKLDRVSSHGGDAFVGRLSHVVTGREFHFSSIDELISRLVACELAVRAEESEP
jgi:hypothetical protein